MQFTKIQSMGNDFVVFGSPSTKRSFSNEFIKRICDRHYGIGADCAIFIGNSSEHDYFMHVYNPDGLEAEICGNALRCSAKYVLNNGYFAKRSFVAETLSGPRYISAEDDGITTEIGKGSLIKKSELHFSGLSLPYYYISMGNPHCVIFTDELTNDEFRYLGPIIETHNDFPNGTNVEFASVSSTDEIVMRVWERGIGETLSCVTGSCACALAAIKEGLCNNNVRVTQSGGTVDVRLRECGSFFVKGNCKIVFKGTFFNEQE